MGSCYLTLWISPTEKSINELEPYTEGLPHSLASLLLHSRFNKAFITNVLTSLISKVTAISQQRNEASVKKNYPKPLRHLMSYELPQKIRANNYYIQYFIVLPETGELRG